MTSDETSSADGRKLVVGKTIHIDGKKFKAHRFRDCILVYSGGVIPELDDCVIEAMTKFRFDEQAFNTVNTLRYFAQIGLMGPQTFKVMFMDPKNG